MNVIGLDGKNYKMNLSGYRKNDRKVSSLHEKCRDLLKELYPLEIILEEVYLPGHGGYADFFIPAQKRIIEVQGQQHFEYNPFFHRSATESEGKIKFGRGQIRDKDKKKWCEINHLTLITLDHNNTHEWPKILRRY